MFRQPRWNRDYDIHDIYYCSIDYFDTAAVTSPIDKMPTIPVLHKLC